MDVILKHDLQGPCVSLLWRREQHAMATCVFEASTLFCVVRCTRPASRLKNSTNELKSVWMFCALSLCCPCAVPALSLRIIALLFDDYSCIILHCLQKLQQKMTALEKLQEEGKVRPSEEVDEAEKAEAPRKKATYLAS